MSISAGIQLTVIPNSLADNAQNLLKNLTDKHPHLFTVLSNSEALLLQDYQTIPDISLRADMMTLAYRMEQHLKAMKNALTDIINTPELIVALRDGYRLSNDFDAGVFELSQFFIDRRNQANRAYYNLQYAEIRWLAEEVQNLRKEFAQLKDEIQRAQQELNNFVDDMQLVATFVKGLDVVLVLAIKVASTL